MGLGEDCSDGVRVGKKASCTGEGEEGAGTLLKGSVLCQQCRRLGSDLGSPAQVADCRQVNELVKVMSH